ncbi:hypothetical protein WG906_06125 [Pedobacter sp. P351]|uniref:hypothetical protein n=1 Tax=Pedobacter superstes TaxID=3133441 RepID=UPI0030B611D1
MQIRQIVERYIQSDRVTRRELKVQVGQSDSTLNSLLGFMDECAVEAVRQRDANYVTLGLYANVLEGSRQDFRDNIINLTKLYHSCIILELNPDLKFKEVSSQTEGTGKELIEKFTMRQPEDKTLQCMGLKTAFSPEFTFVQVDFDDEYLSETEYSEATDQKIISGSH